MVYVILEASKLLWQLAINKFRIKIINRLKYLIKLHSIHKYLSYNDVKYKNIRNYMSKSIN